MKLAKKMTVVTALFALAFGFQMGAGLVQADHEVKSNLTRAYKSNTHRGIRSVPQVKSFAKQAQVHESNQVRIAEVPRVRGGRRA